MKYEWEDLIDTETLEAIEDLLPDGIVLVGVAVANFETVEAALVRHKRLLTGIAFADVALDILGDAERFYEEGRESMREKYERMTTIPHKGDVM